VNCEAEYSIVMSVVETSR